jgi:hypothetical protein
MGEREREGGGGSMQCLAARVAVGASDLVYTSPGVPQRAGASHESGVVHRTPPPLSHSRVRANVVTSSRSWP